MNEIIKVDEIEYYLADDVYKLEPESFIGCSKTSRMIIIKKNMKTKDYLYMKYIKSSNKWNLSNSEYKQAKLLITKKWVYDNLIMFKNNKTDEDLKIEAMKAPLLIELKENEKFVDIDGNELDIEVRGTRDINNIYFKVKDISEKFVLGDVTKILLNHDSSFKIDIHYKLFKTQKIKESNYIKKSQKLLFLTYRGLQKLIEVTHQNHITDNVKYIVHKWLNTLFDNNDLDNYTIKLLDKKIINFVYVY
jgi:hypothetical protein